NAAGADGVTMQGLLDTCRSVSGSDARFTWVEESVLLEQGVKPWSEMPLWVPEANNAFLETGNAKAEASGLSFRSLEATVRETLEWDRTRPAGPRENGISRERESEILRGHSSSEIVRNKG